MEIETLGQRLKAFRKAIKVNQGELADILGVKQALISMVENNKSDLTYKHMKKLKEVYQLNHDWLETGKGGMFLEIPDNVELQQPEAIYTPKMIQRRADRVMAAVSKIMQEFGIKTFEDFCLKNGLYFNYLYEFQAGRIKDPNKLIYEILHLKYKVNLAFLFFEDSNMFTSPNDDLKVLTVAVDAQNNELAKLVPAYAQAGYLKGYADPEYIEGLPNDDFYSDDDGSYRIFELKGDSMYPHLMEGDFVKAKYLPPMHWRDKLRINEVFIVVGVDGVVCKQLKDHNVASGDIVLHSFNDLYEDYTVNLKDVLELWYYKSMYSRRILRDVR